MDKTESLKMKHLHKLAENNPVKAVEELIRLAIKTPSKTNNMIVTERKRKHG